MVKSILLQFEDRVHEELLKLKGSKSWHAWLLELAKGKKNGKRKK